ncbi:MAG: PEP-CTERM sorting domain-containing protein [Candidatus Nealsonbacteria bacterium]|nr:PEP-CTERM sorting domain-containing protein [Candidatus Nealsonbacteria bacterium]
MAVLVVFGLTVLSASFSQAGTIVWEDPGFEFTPDFHTGPWEIGKARAETQLGKVGWTFSLLASGGNPNRRVYMSESGTSNRGHLLVGQHLTIPETAVVVSSQIEVDVQGYCSMSNRSPSVWLRLYTADDWRRFDASLPTGEMVWLDDIPTFWSRYVYGGVGEDYPTWTEFTLGASDAADLSVVLNNRKGEDLVLATVFSMGHANDVEWGSIDNFSVEINTQPIPEPSTFILLTMSTVGLLAYAWRRRK